MATHTEQMRNKRDNRLFTIDGVTKNLSAWIEDSGIKSSTVRQRFYVYNWGIEKSLIMPTRGFRRRITS